MQEDGSHENYCEQHGDERPGVIPPQFSASRAVVEPEGGG